jgi:hypothetical protein
MQPGPAGVRSRPAGVFGKPADLSCNLVCEPCKPACELGRPARVPCKPAGELSHPAGVPCKPVGELRQPAGVCCKPAGELCNRAHVPCNPAWMPSNMTWPCADQHPSHATLQERWTTLLASRVNLRPCPANQLRSHATLRHGLQTCTAALQVCRRAASTAKVATRSIARLKNAFRIRDEVESSAMHPLLRIAQTIGQDAHTSS